MSRRWSRELEELYRETVLPGQVDIFDLLEDEPEEPSGCDLLDDEESWRSGLPTSVRRA